MQQCGRIYLSFNLSLATLYSSMYFKLLHKQYNLLSNNYASNGMYKECSIDLTPELMHLHTFIMIE